jgi:histidinol phosphatase-like PHP family hydrolase
MILSSDFHIHSEASYDANIPVKTIVKRTRELNITEFGISDHVNSPSWLHYLEKSKQLFLENKIPGFHLGVELTVISANQVNYDRQHGSLEGFSETYSNDVIPDIDLPLTLEELNEVGVEYVIAAAHRTFVEKEEESFIKDYHRQQMFLAQDPRVTIVGHPWWVPFEYKDRNGAMTRFLNFDIVPKSMHDEFASALKENGKFMEMNIGAFLHTETRPESFKMQYVEFVRYMFEKGVKITLGTDQHGKQVEGSYLDWRDIAEKYLSKAGFTKKDFSLPVNSEV